jgi:hypothetical protein
MLSMFEAEQENINTKVELHYVRTCKRRCGIEYFNIREDLES